MSNKSGWNKIKYSLNSGMENLMNKSENFIETSKLKHLIHEKEEEMEALYIDIGKSVYKKYKKEESVDSDLIEFCHALSKIEKSVKKLKKQITEVNDKKLCKSCAAEIEDAASYCPECGAKQ